MQWLLLEVVVGAVLLEHVQRSVGDEWEGERRAGFVLLNRLAQAIDGVGADGDEVDACLAEAVGLGGEGAKLLDAVRAAFAEVEDDDHRPAGVVGEGMLFTLAIGQFPLGRGRGAPAERAKRVE